VGALAAARDALAQHQRSHDSLTAAIRSIDTSPRAPARPLLTRLVPAAVLLLVLLAGLALRLVTALRTELRAPTLADAAEAERVTGVRALTTVRDALLDGPARFKPSGVDPFRMLYLGLTATGTRARTAVVVGADPEITAATGARLAIAAAADHRNTLIVDLDPATIALSRTFRERAEPGLRDVLAGAFTWREVARPVGSSDGLPITLLPAGTERDDVLGGEARAAQLAEFERLRSAYELTLSVTPLASADLALELLPGSPVLLEAVSAQRAASRKVAGIVVWDAPRPALPTRAELAASLSKRKGRTPGGSFEAVRKVIDAGNKDTRRP
jgi:Mrp family chromosome partitioning ATPase